MKHAIYTLNIKATMIIKQEVFLMKNFFSKYRRKRIVGQSLYESKPNKMMHETVFKEK